MGVNPGPFTFRELVTMQKGKGKLEWEQTALLASLIAEPNRDRKKQKEPFTPDYFNPYAEKKKPEIIEVPKEEGFKLLKAAFCGMKS